MSFLFNTGKMHQQKVRRFSKPLDLYLHQWVEKEIIKRYELSCLSPHLACLNFFYEKKGMILTPFYDSKADLIIDSCHLPFKNHYWDVWLDAMHIHTLNALPYYFKEVQRVLKKGGWFMGGFLGGDTAKHLRHHFIHIESKLYGTASLRFMPTLQPDYFTSLMANMGFKNSVVECEKIQVSYKTFKAFIEDIRMTGENGILGTPFTYQRALWQDISDHWQSLMPLTLEMIFFKGQT